LFTTLYVVSVLKWDTHRQKPSVKEHKDLPLHRWFYEQFILVTVKSAIFLFAWSWAMFLYKIWFSVFFDCKGGFPYTSCGSGTIWYWVFYSMALTLCALNIVPYLKAASNMMKRLNSHYADTLMRKDKQVIQTQQIKDELMVNFFGVAVGWGYTMLAAAECAQNVSVTCPSTLTVESISLYVGMVAVFIGVAGAGYHSLNQYFRLFARSYKVLCIEEGNTQRLFGDMDKNNDGKISKGELTNYLAENDLDAELFGRAFDNIAKHQVEGDEGEVDSMTLMKDFTELVVALKDGDDVDHALERATHATEKWTPPDDSVEEGDHLLKENENYGSFLEIKVPLHATSEPEPEDHANYQGQSDASVSGASGKSHILKF